MLLNSTWYYGCLAPDAKDRSEPFDLISVRSALCKTVTQDAWFSCDLSLQLFLNETLPKLLSSICTLPTN